MTSSTPRPPSPQPTQGLSRSVTENRVPAADATKASTPHSHIQGHGHGHGKKQPPAKHAPGTQTTEPHHKIAPAASSAKGSRRGQGIKKSHPLVNYAKLMRLDKPIGILLLLWPTLWALWLAAKGVPRIDLLVIFTLGVIVMRSAGCVINDFADRKIDGQVHRTQNRPLATGAVSSREALILFAVLCLMAFGLVLMTDIFTVKLSLVGLLLACVYPFMKRYTHLPQVVLGAAFAWSVPMAFAAQSGKLTPEAGMLYLAVVLWTVVYDTFYAMVDRDDDVKIGVKSTAVLFGEQDRFITGALQVMTILALLMLAPRFGLGLYYYLSLGLVSLLFYYQQTLISDSRPGDCFKAFLNNNWVGLIVFAGISIDFALK